MHLIDPLFERIRSSPFCYRFALFTRYLLAAGFIPTGMVKLLGQRFTRITVENPIGAFFEAMYQTGIYWNFLGLCQVIAGVLLLVPRLAHLGALIFLPIMINIFVITVSLQFGGTPFVTGAMVLAASFLCLWDFHRIRPLLTTSPATATVTHHQLDRWEKVGFGVWIVALTGFFSLLRSSYFFGGQYAVHAMVIGVLAGLFTLARFFWLWRTNQFVRVSQFSNHWRREPPRGPQTAQKKT